MLQSTWALWTDKALRVAADGGFGDANLNNQISDLWRSTIAEARVRFGFVEELPWLIWQCRTQRGAARVMQKYLDEVKRYGLAKAHRVSKLFFDVGAVADAMRSHIDGGGLSDLLDAELRAYELVPLDETIAEASHRDVNRLTGHATAGRMVWWSITQRLEQNLSLHDKVSAAGMAHQFNECFLAWKSVMQFNANKEAKLVPSKMCGKSVVKAIYRTGMWNSADWSIYAKDASKMPRPINVKVLQGDVSAVKKEFLQAVFRRRGVFFLNHSIDEEVAHVRPLAIVDGDSGARQLGVGHGRAGSSGDGGGPLC